ncbi:MAG: DNA mismatch repair protein MutS, partial [Anaerolineales bacterium]
AELLLPETLTLDENGLGHITRLPDWRFESQRAGEKLLEHFGTATLDGFGLGSKPLAISAAGVIVDYLAEAQQPALKLLSALSTYSLDDFMALDAATRRNLELTETLLTGEVRGALLGVIDDTVTPMGRRLLRQWIAKPLLDLERIHHRLDQVQAAFEDGLWRAEIRPALGKLGDLERLSNRASAGLAVPRDLAALRELLTKLPGLIELLGGNKAPALKPLHDRMDPCKKVRQLLEQAIAEDPPATLATTGVIRSGYSKKLDRVVESSRQAREWIANLESVERERTGIKSLKVGYNKVFGYYIEVTKSKTDLVPEEYIRKQTLVNAERYITPEMKEYESKVLTAEDRIREIEAELFHEICASVGEHAIQLMQTARAIARLDVVVALAEVAARKGYVRPEVVEEDVLEVRDGRHPVVEEYLTSGRFVPNDAVFEEGERVRVITGPNMSGKSTYLRQVALIALLAQMGSYVPARSARLGLTDRIFTRIGARDEIHAGQSTFMVEMVETANILHHATHRSLLILDEIGRGTSTYDGVSIAWAVVEYVHNHPKLRARTLFATHYHELTRLAEVLPGVRNYNVAVSEEGGQVVFLHKIVPGGADKSYGIHVAELAGLPRSVINRAQYILVQLEADSGDVGPEEGRVSRQMALFPLTNPLLEELKSLDIDGMTPLEALNKLYEWGQRFLEPPEEEED